MDGVHHKRDPMKSLIGKDSRRRLRAGELHLDRH